MLKIEKRVARKLFNQGVRIYLVPCDCDLNGMWVKPHSIDKHSTEASFDALVDIFEWYNCNSILGKHTAYYIDK